MNKKGMIMALVFGVFSSISFAAGSITLDGKISLISKDKVEISDGINVYSISKKKLNSQQLKSVESAKIGDKTALLVNFDAISDVKKIK